jgi:vanadium chloroperoxidase
MQSFAGAAWGNAKRLVTSQLVDNFAPPPGRTGPTTVIPNAHFADDFKKVQTKGASDDRTRTGDEEVIGIYWGYDGPPELGTPPRLYLQVVLAVLDEIEARNPGGLQEQEELQIIAATGLAMADAGIDAWYYKYSVDHMMWRPVLGIPNGLGALAAPEPGWLPLGRPDTNGSGVNLTPDFPAYPSGHATFGASAFQLLRTFLVHKGLASFTPDGLDDIAFCFVSDEFNGRNRDPRTPRAPRPRLPRKYPNLWEAITDNSISRVFLGVHWQFDGVTIKGPDANGEFGVPETPRELGRRGGVWLGCQIANEVAAKIGISADTIAASLP